MIRAIVFDWAGTLVDFGCFAPVSAFIEAFAAFDIEVGDSEVRKHMGLAKDRHIGEILAAPVTRDQLRQMGKSSLEDQAALQEQILGKWVEFSIKSARRHADAIAGAAEICKWLGDRNIAIGSTTGYPRAIMDVLEPLARKQGIHPQCIVCSDEVAQSRPSPLGMYQNFLKLNVYPASGVIKVDDTAPGMEEAKNAGAIGVGVSLSSCYTGKSEREIALMGAVERADLRERAEQKLYDAGADHVIDTVADLPELVERINGTTT